tara:strand:+ start:24421 stop:24621 length:201 start_codon:yes stop_codon:yes gene_type:complete
MENKTFTEYLMECLDPEECVRIYRERKYGKKAFHKKTNSKNKNKNKRESTSRTIIKPVSGSDVKKL